MVTSDFITDESVVVTITWDDNGDLWCCQVPQPTSWLHHFQVSWRFWLPLMKIILKLVLLVDWLDISGQAYNRAPYELLTVQYHKLVGFHKVLRQFEPIPKILHCKAHLQRPVYHCKFHQIWKGIIRCQYGLRISTSRHYLTLNQSAKYHKESS